MSSSFHHQRKASSSDSLLTKQKSTNNTGNNVHNSARRKSISKMDLSQVVIINVKDQARGMTKEFSSTLGILTENMSYLKNYFEETRKTNISVFCDIWVFEWLLNYATTQPSDPKFEIRSAISILISSEFLGMPVLVKLVIAFIVKNLDHIVSLPIDFGCFSEKHLSLMAKRLSPNSLEEIHDPQDRLKSILYRKKVELCIGSFASQYLWCVNCQELFFGPNEPYLQCRRGNIQIDFHGKMRQRHFIDKSFKLLQNYVYKLRVIESRSWQCIFWTLWGVSQLLHCKICRNAYDATSYDTCITHTYQSDETSSSCTHCNKIANGIRCFSTGGSDGCAISNHISNAPDISQEMLKSIDYVKQFAILRKYELPMEHVVVARLSALSSSIYAAGPIMPASHSRENPNQDTKTTKTINELSADDNGSSPDSYDSSDDASSSDDGVNDPEMNDPEFVSNGWILERQRDIDHAKMCKLIKHLKQARSGNFVQY